MKGIEICGTSVLKFVCFVVVKQMTNIKFSKFANNETLISERTKRIFEALCDACLVFSHRESSQNSCIVRAAVGSRSSSLPHLLLNCLRTRVGLSVRHENRLLVISAVADYLDVSVTFRLPSQHTRVTYLPIYLPTYLPLAHHQHQFHIIVHHDRLPNPTFYHSLTTTNQPPPPPPTPYPSSNHALFGRFLIFALFINKK